MKRLIPFLLAGTLLLTGCTSQAVDLTPKAKELKIQVTGGGEIEFLPGTPLGTPPAAANAGDIDMYCAMVVEMPVFSAADVAVEIGEAVTDPVPLITCTVSEAWTLVSTEVTHGIRTDVYVYGEPAILTPGEETPALFTEWHATNFRVRSGMCGNTAYSDIAATIDRIHIEGMAVQADAFPTDIAAETVWQLLH